MLHGGDVWSLAKRKAIPPEQILDFSADLNPLGPPPGFSRLLKEGCRGISWYPDPTYQEFREAAAGFEGVKPENILPGNGTAELVHLVSRWKGNGRAAVVVPTFTEYERAVTAGQGKLIRWPLQQEQGFAPPSFNGALPFRQAGLLFLCNPNNPTGTLWRREQLLRLIEACQRRQTTVLVDEAYMDLVEEGSRWSLVPFVGKFQRLILLRSLTKTFAIPGLRVGYLAASQRIVKQLAKIQPPWAMNSVAAFVGSHLLRESKSYLDRSRELLRDFRQSLWEGLKKIPLLRPYRSAANFFLCRLEEPACSNRRLADRLRDQGMLIRTCDDFTGLESGRFIRIAVRRPEENRQLLVALRKIFEDAG